MQKIKQPIARVEALQVGFDSREGPVEAVVDLSFDVWPGETLCIVGESGSGKSVTALSLMRLVAFEGGKITGGTMLFDTAAGDRVDLGKSHARAMRRIRGNEIAMIFQEPMTALNPVFTIGRQLTEGLRLHLRLGRAQARQRALELLREVRIAEPERRLRQYPHELSGGMRQRVMIAMALACRPRLLIADEPTTALDVTTQAEILALIERLKRETGSAVIFITHDMAVVAQIADRVVVMYRGRKVEEGPVHTIFDAPQHAYTKALLAAVPRLGQMRGTQAPEPMRPKGQDHAAQPVPGREDLLLQVEGLVTRFPVRGGVLRRNVAQVHAVQDVSFTLNRGRTLALVGESGCGKSSVGRSILRLIEPQAGRVVLGGVEITELGRRDLRHARAAMQMVFQDPFGSLNPQMRLADQVAEPLRNFGMPAKDRAARVAELFDRVALPQSYKGRYPHALSGGQRQRVAIARALALRPSLIVADEAVSALDVSVQAQVLNLMMELQADLGLSYLFISHDMAVVERVSHDVAVMYRGRIVEKGPRAAVFERPQHPYTQALLSAVPDADPKNRMLKQDMIFKPVVSAVHGLGHVPEAPVYHQVSPGHLVLTSECGY